jgi:hypothetical protein
LKWVFKICFILKYELVNQLRFNMQHFFISPHGQRWKERKKDLRKMLLLFFLAKARFVTMDHGSLFSVGKIWCEVPCSRTKVANVLHLAFPFCLPCDGSSYLSIFYWIFVTLTSFTHQSWIKKPLMW